MLHPFMRTNFGEKIWNLRDLEWSFQTEDPSNFQSFARICQLHGIFLKSFHAKYWLNKKLDSHKKHELFHLNKVVMAFSWHWTVKQIEIIFIPKLTRVCNIGRYLRFQLRSISFTLQHSILYFFFGKFCFFPWKVKCKIVQKSHFNPISEIGSVEIFSAVTKICEMNKLLALQNFDCLY